MNDAQMIDWRRKDWASVQQKIREHKIDMGRAGEWIRVYAIHEQIEKINDQLFEYGLLYNQYKKNIMSGCFITMRVKELLKEKEKLKKEQNYLVYKSLPTENRQDITDEMIDRARNYPIEDIVDIKKGMARCVAHADKNPSMNCKNNFAYCHSCGWSGDSIAVAMLNWGTNFQETVKRLQ